MRVTVRVRVWAVGLRVRVRVRVKVKVRVRLITINFTNRIRRFMMEICGFLSREGNDSKGKFTIF